MECSAKVRKDSPSTLRYAVGLLPVLSDPASLDSEFDQFLGYHPVSAQIAVQMVKLAIALGVLSRPRLVEIVKKRPYSVTDRTA